MPAPVRLLRQVLGRCRISRISLRHRLLALSLVLVATGLAVSDTVVLADVRTQQVQRMDQQLQRFALPLSYRSGDRLWGPQNRSPGDGVPAVGDPAVGGAAVGGAAVGGSGPGGPGGAAAGLPSQYVVQFLSPGGRTVRTLRQPVDEGDPVPMLPAQTLTRLAGRLGRPFDVASDHGSGSWRVLVLPLHRQVGASTMVLVAASLDDVDATLAKERISFLEIGAGVLLLIAAVGWFAVRTGLSPLRRIEQDAARIAAGDLSHRMVELSPHTEVGRLSTALNGMLSQIEAAFAARAESEARMRRFVADASHELRTPLAGIRGFAELYRMGALSADADVKRTMSRIENEAVRMGGLVEDLLMLARLDEERPLEPAPMDLRTLAADALHDLTALDPTRTVVLTGPDGVGPPGAAVVLGDEARLRQVVTNLVGNTVKHTPPGTPVRIGVGTASGRGVLEVADSGPGLTEEQADQVFERFYRVDLSRSRQDGGGAGLGLAIAAALVKAHGGALDLVTAPGQGATFRMEIPGAE